MLQDTRRSSRGLSALETVYDFHSGGRTSGKDRNSKANDTSFGQTKSKMLLENLPKHIEDIIIDYKTQLEITDRWKIIMRELFQRFEYFQFALILYKQEFWMH